MKTLLNTILAAGILASAASTHAATVFSQNFDTSPVNYTLPANSTLIHQGTKYWELSKNLGADLNPSILGNTTNYLTGQNMDAALPFAEAAPAQIDFAVNVAGFSNFTLSIDLAGLPSAETANFVRAFTDNDGDGVYETSVFNFVGSNNSPYIDAVTGGQLSATFQTFSNFALSAPTAADQNLRVRFELFNDTDSLNEALAMDNIVVTGIPEPTTGLLIFTGLLGLASRRRKG
ncbi:MAG: hypothetical protein JWL59_373 [Chthoniobacteraceae bacterium]|nr:hypothetical protein [Chthoniobacteraceae bacterium]